MKKILIFSSIFIFLFAFTSFASGKISPALDIIANENNMIKSGVSVSSELHFDTNDFDSALGTNVSSIRVTALPNEKSGRLMLDNLYVVSNQVINRDDFSMLKFVSLDENSLATFKFKPNNSTYEIECSIIPLHQVNHSPVATNGASVSASTKQDASYYGTLLGHDPERNELKFEIVSYPKKALICLTNQQTGDYIYTPYENAKGKDSFTYQVRDSYGNYSSPCTVEIKIEKQKSSTVFSDVEKKDYLAVSYVCENELMSYKTNTNGKLLFSPDENITKEEFVALIMKVMGADNVPTLERTRFADDSEISPKYKGYLESAFSLGIIKGENKTDGVHINPKSPVTLAEAAVILNRILGAKSDTPLTVFADDDEIPNWARESINSLCEVGIIKKDEGKISPNSPLTKAQVASILMSLMKYRSK